MEERHSFLVALWDHLQVLVLIRLNRSFWFHRLKLPAFLRVAFNFGWFLRIIYELKSLVVFGLKRILAN